MSTPVDSWSYGYVRLPRYRRDAVTLTSWFVDGIEAPVSRHLFSTCISLLPPSHIVAPASPFIVILLFASLEMVLVPQNHGFWKIPAGQGGQSRRR